MKTKIHLGESFQSPVWQKWMETLPELIEALPDSQLIYKGRNRIYRIKHEGEWFVIKHFFNRGAWKKLSYRVSSGKARRSFLHSKALIEAGLHSPEPVGWREDWQNGFLNESFFVCRHLSFTHTPRSIRSQQEIDWRPHVENLARAIAQMHDAQLLHLDLTPGNILFVKEKTDDWPIYFIDNNRMSFGKIGSRKGIRSLLQPGIEGTLLEPFIAAYANARGFDQADCQRLYKRLLIRYQRKWKIKNATRPWRRKIGL